MEQSYLGSCFCEKVAFEIKGEFNKFFFCHCSRCRKGTGTVHGTNLFSKTAKFNWASGEEFVKTYEVANSKFSKSFCKNCGSAVPTVRDNNSIVVPAGSLDSDIDSSPTGHIHMASKANWDQNLDQVAKFGIYP